MSKEKIRSLISLLDDPDELVSTSVTNKLLEYGTVALPSLEIAMESINDIDLINRIENIYFLIRKKTISENLKDWSKHRHRDLHEGMNLLSQFQFPYLKEQIINQKIEKICQDVWLELNNNLTALEKINIVNHILFQVYKFKINTSRYKSIDQFFLNTVLTVNEGNVVSLGTIYTIVCQKLNIPVLAVDIPGILILAYVDVPAYDKFFVSKENETVLFYINPFRNGSVFGKKELEFYLTELRLPVSASYFLPCSNIEIIKLQLNVIIDFYKNKQNSKALEYENLLRELFTK